MHTRPHQSDHECPSDHEYPSDHVYVAYVYTCTRPHLESVGVLGCSSHSLLHDLGLLVSFLEAERLLNHAAGRSKQHAHKQAVSVRWSSDHTCRIRHNVLHTRRHRGRRRRKRPTWAPATSVLRLSNSDSATQTQQLGAHPASSAMRPSRLSCRRTSASSIMRS